MSKQPKDETYNLSTEELAVVRPRYAAMQEHTMIAGDLRLIIEQFFQSAVIPRLKDKAVTDNQKISYNIPQGTITFQALPKEEPTKEPDTK